MRAGITILNCVVIVLLWSARFNIGEGVATTTVDCATTLAVPPEPAPQFLPPQDDAFFARWAGSAIVIPADPDDCAITSAEDGVRFDMDADGTPEQVAWTRRGSTMALLAWDRDGDGRITNGRELFGRQTLARESNGTAALIRALDDSNGGIPRATVSAADRFFSALLLWTDRNHNGVSEPTELSPVATRYRDIGLQYQRRHVHDRFGNWYRFSGRATPRTDRERVRSTFEIHLAAGPRLP